MKYLRPRLSNNRSRPTTRLTAVVGLLLSASLVSVGCNQPAVSGSKPGPSAGGNEDGRSGGRDGGNFSVPDAGKEDLGGSGDANPLAGEKCAESSAEAEQVPIDLLLVVDASGSMNYPSGNSTKWKLATEALRAFVGDPRSAGLGVGLSFFPPPAPLSDCTTSADCPHGPDTPSDCRQVAYCGKPGLIEQRGAACLEDAAGFGCKADETCLPVGTCSISKSLCLGVGSACPEGPAGDTV